ncbi:hypothetical protein [Kineosporia sp. NBRC 101731]|uniref:hypothetical protein n=1 Tax=Kineosporia sp. NBRC 101731 TaxID=3032199 RepID=UPI00249FF4DA|nr:hypothetical protein [Kineosporia sp. NBRC 101731]GLY32086.1 hypothetical protein Kisp02_54510 [Kineosporia sp. NBRC 101731]
MRTVYELWTQPTGRGYTLTSEHPTEAEALAAAGLPADAPLSRVENRAIPQPTAEQAAASSYVPADLFIAAERRPDTDTDRVELALELLYEFGQTDGDHHQKWINDQLVRMLTGDDYEGWVEDYQAGEDGPETYSWDEGIAP